MRAHRVTADPVVADGGEATACRTDEWGVRHLPVRASDGTVLAIVQHR